VNQCRKEAAAGESSKCVQQVRAGRVYEMSRARAQLSTASAASEIRNVLTSTDLLFASALRVDGTLELVEYVSHSLSDVQSSILPARVHTTVLFNKTDARTDYPSLVSRNNHAAGQSVRPSSVRFNNKLSVSL